MLHTSPEISRIKTHCPRLFKGVALPLLGGNASDFAGGVLLGSQNSTLARVGNARGGNAEVETEQKHCLQATGA